MTIFRTRNINLLSGLLLLFVGFVVLFEANKIDPPAGLLIGSDFFPKAASYIMLLLGFLQTFLCLLNQYSNKKLIDGREDAMVVHSNSANGSQATTEVFDTRGPLISILLLFLYIFLLETIGFLILTPLYLISQTLILAPPEKRRVLLFCVIALITSAVLYVVFVYGLFVMLPFGILG